MLHCAAHEAQFPVELPWCGAWTSCSPDPLSPSMLYDAGIRAPRAGSEGVDDEIDERKRLDTAISHSLDMFGLTRVTTYEAAVSNGYDHRLAWKEKCRFFHPDSAHNFARRHKLDRGQLQVPAVRLH